ncbi:amidase [Pseudoroseomonas wenyumeiae]|uniref:Amidase n=1 Tax=Teichococcus wenyumeiae TaxID=2478470 RepID=A0A3A9JBY7_9PROT|nr:amidase [Pseudoroseomonas wenyumeiae]RKK02991.1 amidase [Pseudoroseomonas wenyumeiae]RMI15513.1 amidase [Pseudoroseomonas wenyumeiae]
MSDADLLFTPATKAAALIRSGALSPVELTQAVLAEARQVQARLNPFVVLLEDEALASARAAEAAVRSGAPLGPLHGVPVSIKDQVDVRGVRTTYGSAIFADSAEATADDVTVARLRAAGAIIFAKTTLPEFGHKGLTDGPSFGTTRNPWDPARTAGGSSGGAAVAVATGLGPIALGMDGAGSIRIPAACCGVVGLKPTLGSIPWQQGADAFGNYTYAGPMARTLADLATMRAVLAGPDASDPWSLRAADLPLSPALAGRDLHGLRIGVIEHAANARLQREMAANLQASVSVFEALGAAVDMAGADIDWMEMPGRVMYQANFAISQRRYLAEWRDRMDPTLLAFMERGDGFSLTEFREGQYARTRLFRAIQRLFERFDVLVTPTLSRTALPADFDAAHDEVEVEGELCGITRQGWSSYVYPFNLTGHPALTVPNGFDDAGLPTGVQLVGRWGAELDLLRLGSVLEEARPWAACRPSEVQVA